jgi:hypothetical protein
MNSRLVVASLFLVGMIGGCGSSENPAANPPVPPPPPTLAPSTFADLSAAVTSPQHGQALNCRDHVHARVTVTNRGGTSVRTTGINRTATVVSGRCTPAPDFTYGRAVDFALPDSTTVMIDQTLFRNGSGCCSNARSCSGSCTFRDDFTVVTDLGLLPAGHIEYSVEFSNCPECTASASSRSDCPPGRRLDER